MRIKLKKLLKKKLVKELAYRVEPLRAFFHLTEKKVASVPVSFDSSIWRVIGTLVSHIMSFFSQKRPSIRKKPLLFSLVTFSICLFVCLFKLGDF
jgi:hypothetical protein